MRPNKYSLVLSKASWPLTYSLPLLPGYHGAAQQLDSKPSDFLSSFPICTSCLSTFRCSLAAFFFSAVRMMYGVTASESFPQTFDTFCLLDPSWLLLQQGRRVRIRWQIKTKTLMPKLASTIFWRLLSDMEWNMWFCLYFKYKKYTNVSCIFTC